MRTSTTNTPTLTKKDRHLLAYAVGLTTYADRHPDFARELALAIRSQDWTKTEDIKVSASKYQTPSTQNEALTTAHWLFTSLIEAKDGPHTKGHLVTWASDQEIPKNIIIGIIGISIMGPTLGILDEIKKKKKSQLQVVVEDSHFDTLNKSELSKLSASLAQRVFAHEVKLAGGNVYRLHPDTAEWYLSEPELKLYRVDNKTLAELQATAKNENLTTHAKYKNDQLVALAISPSIDNALVEDRDAKLV